MTKAATSVYSARQALRHVRQLFHTDSQLRYAARKLPYRRNIDACRRRLIVKVLKRLDWIDDLRATLVVSKVIRELGGA